MTEASLALQKAVRLQLIAAPAVVVLVPAAAIFDRHSRPEAFPCIVIGEGQVIEDPAPIARDRVGAYLDLHLWTKEPGLLLAKQIAGVVRAALRAGPWTVDDHHVADLKVSGTRFLRDPSGEHSHAVLTVEALLVELAP